MSGSDQTSVRVQDRGAKRRLGDAVKMADFNRTDESRAKSKIQSEVRVQVIHPTGHKYRQSQSKMTAAKARQKSMTGNPKYIQTEQNAEQARYRG